MRSYTRIYNNRDDIYAIHNIFLPLVMTKLQHRYINVGCGYLENDNVYNFDFTSIFFQLFCGIDFITFKVNATNRDMQMV